MGIRKNAKFLTPAEREDFVKACVFMKADIVNPGAPAASRYSKWDEYHAIHTMIQQAFAPGVSSMNFGHGGSGSFSFLSWHRYFLYQFEKDLQGYVPGVMLPYWDWTNPSSIMTDTFMGPNSNLALGNVVRTGYFALESPGTGANSTPLPAWWPASLDGWKLPAMFPLTIVGGLKRQTGSTASLPTITHIRETLAKTSYAPFQDALESGSGLTFPGNQMHNGMHGWIGGSGGHMNNPSASPFDPFFYLHHCNIDRLWAMWQLDGHQNEYPTSGGNLHHHRNDIMYPWTGGAAGYGTNSSISSAIPMPDFSAIGAKRNVDTLDFRNSMGYTYDTIAIIGIGLDRTGSMNGLTPDPMVSTAPDVTKWEAAKRGVSAFLQDCETVQNSGTTYVMAGIKTFRSLGGNQFDSVFGAPNYGLVKTGTSFSRATFDSVISTMTPGGGTPLADALNNVQNTLVEPPFGGNPADEQRYMAFLTDGMLTSGAPMSSIPNGSFGRTAIFAMGFGTGADVDYPTLDSMVAKGKSLSTQQVFHGENAGTIDKFYSNALASAIGFTTIFDPVVELFAGEHFHLDFNATSADDAFFITAQGMDFQDSNWSFMLHGPNGQVVYGNGTDHQHEAGCNHCCVSPDVTGKRSNGRLSLVIQRGNTGKECWVGKWQLMVSYKARHMDSMVMPELGELLVPVAAGSIRGPRYARLTIDPKKRTATRNIFPKSTHGLGAIAVGSNSNSNEACNVVVNIYGRTNLKMDLEVKNGLIKMKEEIKINVLENVNLGRIQNHRGFARIISPALDINKLLPTDRVHEIIKEAEDSKKRFSSKLDIALLLARLEKENKDIQLINDSEGKVVSHDGGSFHMHVKDTEIPGLYHFGVWVEGVYFPDAAAKDASDGHHAAETNEANLQGGEEFSRLLNITVAVGE